MKTDRDCEQGSPNEHLGHGGSMTGSADKVRCDFGVALFAIKNGRRVCRSGWNGTGMWIALQLADAQSKMSLPYIFMHTVKAQRVPWLASQTDLLAADWMVLLD